MSRNKYIGEGRMKNIRQYNKSIDQEPVKHNKDHFVGDVFLCASGKYLYIFNGEDDFEDEDINEDGEYDSDFKNLTILGKMTDKLSLPLTDILEYVEKNKIDPKQVYLTLSSNDDWISLEAMNIRKLSQEEIDEKYEEEMEEYQIVMDNKNKNRVHQLERQLKTMTEELEKLKK